jgi:hypothetical protein
MILIPEIKIWLALGTCGGKKKKGKLGKKIIFFIMSSFVLSYMVSVMYGILHHFNVGQNKRCLVVYT